MTTVPCEDHEHARVPIWQRLCWHGFIRDVCPIHNPPAPADEPGDCAFSTPTKHAVEGGQR